MALYRGDRSFAYQRPGQCAQHVRQLDRQFHVCLASAEIVYTSQTANRCPVLFSSRQLPSTTSDTGRTLSSPSCKSSVPLQVYASVLTPNSNAAIVPLVYFFYPETAYRSLEEVDAIFYAVAKSARPWLSAVSIAREHPLWYGKNGEGMAEYEQSEWHRHIMESQKEKSSEDSAFSSSSGERSTAPKERDMGTAF